MGAYSVLILRNRLHQSIDRRAYFVKGNAKIEGDLVFRVISAYNACTGKNGTKDSLGEAWYE
jgi:hypothetical protein